MTTTIELPVWLFVLILLFAGVTFASHFLFPSVRWFFRRRMEKVVGRLNERLERPIEPFKLARRYDMIQRLIYDPEVSRAIAEHAQSNGVPESVAFQKAKSYAREIVPRFSATAYFGFAIRIARFLSTALYRVKLVESDAKALKEIDPDATVIYVINHRSNMDYVLVTYLAAQRSALAYAVGEWARVWPLSSLIRAMGAYFIRRRSRGALYRKVLARYVRLATDGGVAQAMFPEGGLSLDGALQPAKLGLLKYITDGFETGGRDVVFVPVALNYDRVLEDRILIDAEKRGQRRFRARISVVLTFTIKQVWLRMRGKYHRMGYAAVSYGDPLSLTGFIGARKGDVTEDLALELMARIGRVVPVMSVPLVAALIRREGAMSEKEAALAIGELLQSMPCSHLHLPGGTPEKAAGTGLRILAARRILTQEDGRFRITEGEEGAVAFYANSIRHLLP